jgi:glycosyltransferase involved in cell wall biosynthesis
MKPRILQMIDSFDQGGTERQALQLTRALQETGRYEIYFASLHIDGPLRPEFEGLGLREITSYPLSSFYDANAVKQLIRFSRYLRRNRIDVLQTHDFYSNIFGMTAGFLARVPVRIASRRETNGIRSSAQKRAHRFAFSLAHHVIANCDAVRQILIDEGLRADEITVVHNSFDASRVSFACLSRDKALASLGISVSPESRFVTLVANMRLEVKDQPMFLRAAQRVREAMPETVFLLAGEGELLDATKKLTGELGLGEATRFLGRCGELAELLSISDVCVLSSKAEGFSNAILEYMAAGRPVVATDVGGAREAIVEGETGYLVSSGDDEAMAARIITLLADPARANRMGKQGKRVVDEKFSRAAQLRSIEALYEKLLSTRIPRPLPRAASMTEENA